MTQHLYNCKHSGDQYRITKFDMDLNPIPDSSYLTSLFECDCPAGHRDTCRHRQMLSRFLTNNHTSGEAFHNYERNTWIGAAGAQVNEEANEPLCAEGAVVNERSHTLDAFQPPLPPGINLLSLADPLATHNAIAAALGEPQLALSPRLLDLQPTRQLPPSPELGNPPSTKLKRRV